MLLPPPRGPVSQLISQWLATESTPDQAHMHAIVSAAQTNRQVIAAEDLQLSLSDEEEVGRVWQ